MNLARRARAHLIMEARPRVYVAGACTVENMPRVRTIESKLRTLGFNVTGRWSENDPALLYTLEDLKRFANQNYDAVRYADAVLALMDDPTYAYRGTSMEVGAAEALRIPAVVVRSTNGSVHENNVMFMGSNTTVVYDIDSALDALFTLTR